ncbi:hypothetical protein LT493_23090 [Streptomyces tricolor]|nr:hypothetical protein [Streptomyces tricolor]
MNRIGGNVVVFDFISDDVAEADLRSPDPQHPASAGPGPPARPPHRGQGPARAAGALHPGPSGTGAAASAWCWRPTWSTRSPARCSPRPTSGRVPRWW